MNKQAQLRQIAIQAKKRLTREKKREQIKNLPNPPIMLSLTELQKKTGLSYQLLRKMIVEENQMPYIHTGKKYLVNYDLFLELLERGNTNGEK